MKPPTIDAVEGRWDKLSLGLLFLFAVFRLWLIAQSQLKFEEAYYWDYSQHPSLSYFDHPPMVAWMIGLSTHLLGNSPFAVRLPAVLSFLGASWLLWRLAHQLFGPRAAFYTVLLINSLPAFALHSFIILPDNPLLFCWTLGLYAGWQLVSRHDTRWWWLVGLATGLGLDSKYPALLIPLGIFLYCLSDYKTRGKLALAPAMFGAALLAMALFAPVIVWNLQHDLASFRFQGGERMHQAVNLHEKLGSWLFQFGLLSPTGFIALGLALIWGWRQRQRQEVAYLLCWSLPFLTLMIYVSTRRLVQINWPLPGYIACLPLMAAWLEDLRSRWTVISVVGLAFLLSTALWLPLVFAIGAINSIDDINDWQPLGDQALRLRQSMPDPQRTFLAGVGYQAAAELAYTTGLPHLTLSSNILGERTVSFSFWETPASFRDWDGIVANYAQPRSNGEWRERVPLDLDKLKASFQRVEEPETLIVERGGRPLRRYQYYRCFGYRPPPDPTP